jgi:RHS repeat-associated protein
MSFLTFISARTHQFLTTTKKAFTNLLGKESSMARQRSSLSSVLIMLTALIVTVPAQADLQLFFVHNDHLGTPKYLTDTTGKAVWQAQSTPFGEVLEKEDLDGDGKYVTLNMRFPGQYWDHETGTSYNYFRDYEPSLGRYIQSDPIGLGGGINTYVYVNDNPVNYIDPYGLWPFGLPGKGDALKNGPSWVDSYVPGLTHEQRDQLTKDGIDTLGWGDLAGAKKVFPGYDQMELPDNLGQLSDAQRKFICNFAKKLPNRNAEAIKKICDECKQ